MRTKVFKEATFQWSRFIADHIYINGTATADDLVSHRCSEQIDYPWANGLANNNAGDIILLGKIDHCLGNRAPGQRHYLGSQFLCQANGF